jgi:two-component system sensor histidine kinase BaeS
MKISIKYRLFLAFLIATCTLVGCMFLVMKISFDRGFLRYINNIEQDRLAQLVDNLQTAYGSHGNWEFLRDNPVVWFRLQADTLPEDLPTPPPLRKREQHLTMDAPPENWRPRRMMRQPPLQFERRVVLLDANQEQIFGPRHYREKVTPKPLIIKGETIGYLGLLPPKNIVNPLQQQFVRKQRRSFAVIALVMAAAAALLSLPLSRRLVRRITNLAAATHLLTAGQYDTRVPAGASDELGQLAQDFNSLAQTLEKNQQLRRQWVADISHELRTPLAVLRGEIEALQDGVRPQSPESLSMLHDEVMQLNRLVEDLYQLSLADINALTYCKESTDLGETLRQAVEPFRGEFADRGIELSFEIPPANTLLMQGDKRRLHQLFSNLLKNSLRYTDGGGNLKIRAIRNNDQFAIHFEDSTPGVPEDKLEHLFDRLFRVEGSRSRNTGGAGLGLALCKAIVEAHDGTITARPSTLGGLWVEILMPTKGTLS